MKPGDQSCHQSDSHTAELQFWGGCRSYAFSPRSSECYCKYVTLKSTCWCCVHLKCAWGFWKCFGSSESNDTHRFEPWAQYCKCLTGCNHSAYYFVFGNCGQLMFPVQLWPCYTVLCWTVILFGCNSNMFEQNHIHLQSAGFVHRILHDYTDFICVPTLGGGGFIQVTVYYVRLVCKISFKTNKPQ